MQLPGADTAATRLPMFRKSIIMRARKVGARLAYDSMFNTRLTHPASALNSACCPLHTRLCIRTRDFPTPFSHCVCVCKQQGMRNVCLKLDAEPNRGDGGVGISLLCGPANTREQDFGHVCMHRLPQISVLQQAHIQEDISSSNAVDMEAGSPIRHQLYECEIASADVDMWMEFMADNTIVSQCDRHVYLEQLDCIWGVNPAIRIADVRPLSLAVAAVNCACLCFDAFSWNVRLCATTVEYVRGRRCNSGGRRPRQAASKPSIPSSYFRYDHTRLARLR
jgi:hypothetical protein